MGSTQTHCKPLRIRPGLRIAWCGPEVWRKEEEDTSRLEGVPRKNTGVSQSGEAVWDPVRLAVRF